MFGHVISLFFPLLLASDVKQKAGTFSGKWKKKKRGRRRHTEKHKEEEDDDDQVA